MLSGPGPPAWEPVDEAGDFPNGYFLAVGALEPRKLPSALVAGHRRARANGLRAELVFAGDGPLHGQLERSGRFSPGHVSDEELDALYSGALAVTCVSREEGFGFTPLEAAARGTPSIVADLPVFDETFGDAAAARAGRRPGRPGRRPPAAGAGLGVPGPARGGRAGGRGAPLLGANRPRDARGPPGSGRVVSRFAIVTVIHDSEPSSRGCSTRSAGCRIRGRR